MNDLLNLSFRRLAAFLVVILLFLLIVDAAMLQLQMFLTGGNILVGNFIFKIAVLAIAGLGFLIYPKLRHTGLPIITWMLCIAYMIGDMPHLMSGRGMTLVDVLQSYNAYYALILIGPVLLAFRGAVSERAITRCAVFLLSVCVIIGLAQFFTGQPLLFTESSDGTFHINSWNFFDNVRAFSLFTSSMNFGLFCALPGSLGVALYREKPTKGALLFVASAIACYATLTRLSYLVFACACSYALVLTFGKKARRGLWHPLLYFALGISIMFVGLISFTAEESNLQDTGSLIMRIGQWGFYSELILQSSATDKVFGLGIVQNEKLSSDLPMLIDCAPLALVLHVGVVGLMLFGALLVQMWLYLRREALASGQPFAIAAASFWATLACAGIFNIVFSSFGAVFALAILCAHKNETIMHHQGKRRSSDGGLKRLQPDLVGTLKQA
jgi:hypothetical protein